jgi:hypothetical protein
VPQEDVRVNRARADDVLAVVSTIPTYQISELQNVSWSNFRTTKHVVVVVVVVVVVAVVVVVVVKKKTIKLTKTKTKKRN